MTGASADEICNRRTVSSVVRGVIFQQHAQPGGAQVGVTGERA